jgi:hypothetical protein
MQTTRGRIRRVGLTPATAALQSAIHRYTVYRFALAELLGSLIRD